jgi:glycosyltransferase involved in cell wall biosynthesis
MHAALLHRSVVKRDAIGNDVAHMYRILNQQHVCRVYADHLDYDGLQAMDGEALEELADDPANLLIYHHSLVWEEIEPFLSRARARVIVKYHNITPPSFFRGYSDFWTRQCRRGRKQTTRLRQRHPGFMWMGDSLYNLQDAKLGRHPRAAVIPPFNNAESWEAVFPDPGLLRRLVESREINLLFVGRFAPNKGLDFLLEIVADHASAYDRNIALHLVGKRDAQLAALNEHLDRMVVDLGIADLVHWVGEISDRDLLSYFLGCDFYVNCSQHEGFCVPLVEAQSLLLPILARRSGVMAETLQEEQLVLGEDVPEYSAAIRLLSRPENTSYREYLRKAGLANYRSRFLNSVIETRFRRALREWLGEEI